MASRGFRQLLSSLGGMTVRVKPKIIAVESPTARRRVKGYRLWVIGYRMGLFGTVGVLVLPPRRNAQIIIVNSEQ